MDNNNLNYVSHFAAREKAMEREAITLIICERILNALCRNVKKEMALLEGEDSLRAKRSTSADTQTHTCIHTLCRSLHECLQNQFTVYLLSSMYQPKIHNKKKKNVKQHHRVCVESKIDERSVAYVICFTVDE